MAVVMADSDEASKVPVIVHVSTTESTVPRGEYRACFVVASWASPVGNV